MGREERIERRIEWLTLLCGRYYWCVYLLIGMMSLLNDDSRFSFRFVSSSRRMNATDGSGLIAKPDVVLQNTENTKGILVEIKMAFPDGQLEFTKQMKKVIDQLASMDADVSGWDGVNGSIDEYCLVLMPYNESNSKKALMQIDELQKSKKLTLKHPLAIWFWSIDRSQKTVGDVIQIFNTEVGRGIGYEIGDFLKGANISIELEDLFMKYEREKYRFCRDPPENDIHTIIIIYDVLSPLLRKGPEMKIICTVEGHCCV